MNNGEEVEVRPRPLSTGLWTIFSWLRRDDRSVSSESLSSAGSDRTVASFSFLSPAHYQTTTEPLALPPPGPPTDSYKKRVHDRNIRRHQDLDLTLHRKYGLFKCEGTYSYDAFSLPPVRRINAESVNRWDRERRATSECYQRRLAHVPGKRRAPLPPVPSVGPTTSLNRRSSRKRPAPQPPGRSLEKKDILKDMDVNSIHPKTQTSSNTFQNKPKSRNNDVTIGCKSEKYSKKELNPKNVKNKPEKNFLKQIFDSKKRNSGISISTVKVLPSISELDKQAAELIETCKFGPPEQNNVTLKNIDPHNSNETEFWFCIRCLRKYNSSVVTCTYCVSKTGLSAVAGTVKDDRSVISTTSNTTYTQTGNDLQKISSSSRYIDNEDKQKLKEMLKEMKDSLPKRPKHEVNNKNQNNFTVESKKIKEKPYSSETPTLRVGSTAQVEKGTNPILQPSASNITIQFSASSKTKPISSTHESYQIPTQSALVTQVISSHKNALDNNLQVAAKLAANERMENALHTVKVKDSKVKEHEKYQRNETIEQPMVTNSLNTPLKISSLLNPMYIPRNRVVEKPHIAKVIPPELNNRIPNSCLKTEIPKSEAKNETTKSENRKPTPDKVILSEISSVPNCSIGKLPEPSTSLGVTVSNDRIENKYKNDLETKKVVESSNLNRNIPELSSLKNSTSNMETHNLHSRRRDLINQLEKSIAKGDELAAAEAAAKLAQLRLSCSVLSFSSQILSQSSASTSAKEDIEKMKVDSSIMINTTNNKSYQDVHKNLQPATSSSIMGISTPKITAKVTPTAILEPNKVPVVKLEIPKVMLHNKNNNLDFQKNVHDAKKDIENDDLINIKIMVEDREATRGPVNLRISRRATVRNLRREAELSLGVATNLQRWIIGRTLCVNDVTPVTSLAGPDFNAPFYLCVVESDIKVEVTKSNATASHETKGPQGTARNVYTELVQLEQQALVPNTETFECGVCMEDYQPGQGVVLRECVHIFCKNCLSDVVRHCEEPDVPCPAMGCRGMIQEREIRALVTQEDYERWLARGLAAAESGTRNAFHCRTRDCKGWALCDPGVQRFPCPVCSCINCVPCQAIHSGETCDEHRAKLKLAASTNINPNETDDGTRTLLNSLIKKGEALECPECRAIITKKWGCDWVKCSACKTEICWVTRGRRWGPGGKGDTSGGCRCGVDGKRCHPSCGYCH